MKTIREPRTEKLTFRVSEYERATLEGRARRNGLSLSNYLREMVLK